MQTSCCFPNSYVNIKKNLKIDTARVGAAVSGYYFISHGVSLGMSSLLGSSASFMYISMLSNHVDNIAQDKGSSSNHLLVPLCMTLSETLWNSHHPDLHLDFITTFIGFFSYKLAVSRIVYDAIRSDVKDMIEKN
jgi:hypothetical protein